VGVGVGAGVGVGVRRCIYDRPKSPYFDFPKLTCGICQTKLTVSFSSTRCPPVIGIVKVFASFTPEERV